MANWLIGYFIRKRGREIFNLILKFISVRKVLIVKNHELQGGIELTKLMIVVFLLAIFFMSAQAHGIDGSEYGAGQNAIALNSSKVSNWQLPSGNLNGSQAAMAGNISLILNKSTIQFINHSIDIGYNGSPGFKLSNFSLKLNNLSNLSISSGTANNSKFYKNLYTPKEMGLKLDEMYSNPMGLHYALQTNSNNMNGNLAGNLSLKPANNQELNKIEPFNYTNQSEGSIIIVHPGESIQDAIEAATPGEVIEIESGIYNECIQIDKSLAIRGMDIGGGLPIIDAGGIGNAAEVSADGVILEKIIFTNSSRSGLSPGAGIRISSSRNCSIEEIVSYSNYYGIDLADSNDNNISSSNISINQIGIRIYYSNDNRFEHNNVNKNTNPLDIISSTGNLIQESNFRDNLNEIEASIENKIINNKEIIKKIETETKVGVDRNTEPRTPSKHSESGGIGVDWTEQVVTAGQAKNCNILAHEAAGTVLFNPPSVMTIGVGEWIDARIGLENTTSLVQGLLGKGDVQFRDIAVAMNMTYIVKLESDSGFEISEKRPAVQVLGKDPAIWLWLVKPLEAGNHTLILSVDLQLEKPPYDSRCVNVTYWPVAVRVLEPSLQQKSMNILSSSYSFIAGSIAFLASVISLILLFRQFRQRKN